MTDSQWEVIEEILGDQRKRKYSLRQILNALFYLNRSGCQWRMIPKEYPPYGICFYYYRKWSRDKTWERLNQALNRLVRLQAGRKSSPSVGVIDAQSVKNSERGVIDKGFDGNKKIQGRKRHIVIDTLGLILVAVVHPANIHDSKGAYGVLSRLKEMNYRRMKMILADQGYRGCLSIWVEQHCKWLLKIVKPVPEDRFSVIPMRWKVERTFSWLMWQRRLSRDFECMLDSAENQIYIANIYRCLRKI